MWNGFEDVDARNKCGHDKSEIVAVGLSLGERSRTLSKGKGTYLFCEPDFMELLDEPVVELEI